MKSKYSSPMKTIFKQRAEKEKRHMVTEFRGGCLLFYSRFAINLKKNEIHVLKHSIST